MNMENYEILEIAETAKNEFLSKLVGFNLLIPIHIEINREKTRGNPASGGPCNSYRVYCIYLNPEMIVQKSQELSIQGDEEVDHIRYLVCHELAHQFTWKAQKQLEEELGVNPGEDQAIAKIADLITDEIVIRACPQFKKFADKYY